MCNFVNDNASLPNWNYHYRGEYIFHSSDNSIDSSSGEIWKRERFLFFFVPCTSTPASRNIWGFVSDADTLSKLSLGPWCDGYTVYGGLSMFKVASVKA